MAGNTCWMCGAAFPFLAKGGGRMVWHGSDDQGGSQTLGCDLCPVCFPRYLKHTMDVRDRTRAQKLDQAQRAQQAAAAAQIVDPEEVPAGALSAETKAPEPSAETPPALPDGKAAES